MVSKVNVLFVCIHNSARSQMAEAFLNHLAGHYFFAQSAGLEPGKLNSVVVDVMTEVGIDISKNQTKTVADMIAKGKLFDYVITVCDETSAERCPVFPGRAKRLHWGFPDPAAIVGSSDEKLAQTRKIRDAIKEKIQNWAGAPEFAE